MKMNQLEQRDPVIHGHTLSILMQEQKMRCSKCGCREYIIVKCNGELRADCNKCRATCSNIEVKVRS